MMDRRKRKSQKAIQEACLALIREKDFEAITISDLTERADLNRGTFYLHYEDKYDMLEQFENQFIAQLQEIIIMKRNNVKNLQELIYSRYGSLVAIFECFQTNKEVLEIILQTKGIISLQNRLGHLIEDFFKDEELLQKYIQQVVPAELFRLILSSICLSIVQYWIAEKKEVSPDTLAKGMLHIIVNGPVRAAGFITEGIIDINELIVDQ